MKPAKLIVAALLAMSSCTGINRPCDSLKTDLRAPSVPLVTVDPYFSIWSPCDNLNDTVTVHWTGVQSPLLCLVRVDGVTYRILGKEEPSYRTLLKNARQEAWTARYFMGDNPGKDWMSESFNDSSWKEGEGAFSSDPSSFRRTVWKDEMSNIWIRRTFTLDELPSNPEDMLWYLDHDDACELYLNGTEVFSTGDNWTTKGEYFKMSAQAASLLRKGENTLAIHCFNKYHGACVDCGIVEVIRPGCSSEKARQTDISVLPTRTVAKFACGPVSVDLTFTAPLMLDNLDLVSRPVNYVTYDVCSADGKEHDVQVFFGASPKQAVNSEAQAIKAEAGVRGGVNFAKAGTVEQKILGKRGDNVRIDWGYVYIASNDCDAKVALTGYNPTLESFMSEGHLPECLGNAERESAYDDLLSLSYANDLGRVGKKPRSEFLMLAYDDLYSIQYMGENLRPYWNRNGDKTIFDQIDDAAAEYATLMKECRKFDKKLMEDAIECGGKEYAELCALAYRQSISAHKLVESPEAGLLWLSKENFSNGSIGTVDVTYPSAPLYLYYNLDLAKGLLNHIFNYCGSERWNKPFAAHDVGTYPLANGQTYGGDMPVEENGNMLILTAAIAKIEGNADYAAKHWDLLTTWAEYLSEFGLDPENQLCTDDFAGHFAHNVNLSVKAIMGLEGYSILAGMLGKADVAEKYDDMARQMAASWKEMAADGDHYKLTFDKEGTWSQKYNMVWDKLWGTGVFDPTIMKSEIEYYKQRQNEYGLPLDSRKTYTKTDWIIWTATMADSKEDFELFVRPVYKFMNETVERIPMSDWVYTDSKKHVGFQARSVVGGYYIKLLSSMEGTGLGHKRP